MEELQLECAMIRKFLRMHSLTNTWLICQLRKQGIDIGPGRLCDVLKLRNGGTFHEREVIYASKKVLAEYQNLYERPLR